MYKKHPDIAARWEDETPAGKLPQHVKKKKKTTKSKKKRTK
jgi:hypothetical protein